MWPVSILLLTVGVSVETSTKAPFAASVSLDASVGGGTFVAYDKADDPLYASTLSISPTWSIDQHLNLAASLSFTYEWTHLVTACSAASGPRALGAPAGDCSDTNDPSGRRSALSDLELSISHDELYTIEMFTFSAAGSVALPTSRESQAVSNVMTIGGSLSASADLEPFTFALGLGFNKFFPTAEAAVLDSVEAEARARGGVPVIRCASFRRDTCLLLSGFVPTYRAAIGVDAKFLAPWIEGLSASIAFGYQYSRRFGRTLDGASSGKTDVDGRPIVDGTNEDDSTSGTLELAYELDERWSFAFGVTSQQPARTADGKSLRFPFYDFISPASNYSAWYLSGTFSL
jgi:hypothetical protein